MSVYDDKPWKARYAPDVPPQAQSCFPDAVSMFHATVTRNPGCDAIRYFGRRITFAELDELSDAFAAGLAANGFQPGERVAIYVQNIPQFLIAQLGTWKVGGIAVSVNPMYKQRELADLLRDSRATVLVCLESLHRDVAATVVSDTAVRLVLTTSELDLKSHEEPRVFAGVERISCPGTTDLLHFLQDYRGADMPGQTLGPDDIALLTYTSGTTGPPKGAMTTHHNIVFNAATYRDWAGLGPDDVVLGIAPLFHITGLVGHIAVTLLTGAPLVLMYRLDPGLTLDTVEAEGATFTVGSITAFTALMEAPNAEQEKLTTLTKIYSGGAPIPPGTVQRFEDAFGHYIHNIYGLTETTSPSHAVPFGVRAPVDQASGALSVGVPVCDTIVRVVDEHGHDLPAGEIGELVTAGPQVVAGYWEKPDETANALPGGELHTGDVGYMDSDGWFYVVDRKKDQINAGGYKVWPREVEDVLCDHPAVQEAAVVGVSDEYRGETVNAFVSLQTGTAATPDELIQFARQHLAAYKYPRTIEIFQEIPKTASGKILRRQLRS